MPDFVLNYYREAGAIIEPPAYGVHEVLLPDALAAHLGVSAYQRLAFDDMPTAETEGSVRDLRPIDEVTHLSYGHPLIESLIEAARQVPACARLYVNAVRLDKRGLADLAHQALSFPNARLVEVEGQTESRVLGHYVRFNFKAALITDEKREQLLSVLMDAQGGYAVEELADIERLVTLETEPGFERLPVMPPGWLPDEEPLSRRALEGLLERAKRAALDELAEPLESLQRRAARFL